jgi:hypothetical protein
MNALKRDIEGMPYVRRPARSIRETNKKAEAQPTIDEIARKGRTRRGIALSSPAQKIINGTIQEKG